MQTILSLLAECEQSISLVVSSLSDDGDVSLDEANHMADICLEVIGVSIGELKVDAEAVVHQSLTEDILELQTMFQGLLDAPKAFKGEKDEFESSRTTDNSSISGDEYDLHSKHQPQPKQVMTSMALPLKKRVKGVSVRYHHEKRAMWDFFERTCLQSHVDRHRVARLHRQNEKSKLKVCVDARLQTVSKRALKPRELLPDPKPPMKYLNRYQDYPANLKPKLKPSPPTLKGARSALLLSIYLYPNRERIKRFYASSIDDLKVKSAYKLGIDHVEGFVREVAHIDRNGLYNKYTHVQSFSQLQNGDILCVLHSASNSSEQLDTLRKPQGRIGAQQRHDTSIVNASIAQCTKQIYCGLDMRDTSNCWDYNGRVMGLN